MIKSRTRFARYRRPALKAGRVPVLWFPRCGFHGLRRKKSKLGNRRGRRLRQLSLRVVNSGGGHESTRDQHGQPIAGGDYERRSSVRLADRAVIFMPFLRRFSPFPPAFRDFCSTPERPRAIVHPAPPSSKLAPSSEATG